MNDCNYNEHFFLSENLRTLRKRLSLSQEELADKVGLNRGNIASYENGTAEPKICNLMKFAHLFKVSVFDITHSDLRVEEHFQRALQFNTRENGLVAPQAIQNFAIEAEDFNNAIKGLTCLYRIKSGNGDSQPDEIKILKDQYEQLYSLTQHLMRSHNELISYLLQNCPEHQKSVE